MKPITARELISELKKLDPTTLVGISVDSEGNAYSLIADEQFLMEGFCEPRLGYVDIEGDPGGNQKAVVILFGSN